MTTVIDTRWVWPNVEVKMLIFSPVIFFLKSLLLLWKLNVKRSWHWKLRSYSDERENCLVLGEKNFDNAIVTICLLSSFPLSVARSSALTEDTLRSQGRDDQTALSDNTASILEGEKQHRWSIPPLRQMLHTFCTYLLLCFERHSENYLFVKIFKK